MSDAELRVWALQYAMEIKGDKHWKIETIVKWADKFYNYFKTGVWVNDEQG